MVIINNNLVVKGSYRIETSILSLLRLPVLEGCLGVGRWGAAASGLTRIRHLAFAIVSKGIE